MFATLHSIPGVLLVFTLGLVMTGCSRVMNALVYKMDCGFVIPVEYDGLKNRRVAIVCTKLTGQTGFDRDMQDIASAVVNGLKRDVNGIAIVNQSDIDNWMDRSDSFSKINFAQLAEAVSAERVLSIEFGNLQFPDTRRLNPGHAQFLVAVYESTSGKRKFLYDEPDFVFLTANKSNSDIRARSIEQLADEIVAMFH